MGKTKTLKQSEVKYFEKLFKAGKIFCCIFSHPKLFTG